MHYEKLESLIEKNAGSTAMSLNLPYMEPQIVVIDGAIAVQESLRSPWTFIGLDQNGNTLWLSPDENNLLQVDQEGVIELERI